MKRLLIVFLSLVATLLALGGAVSYFSYGVEALPERARLAGLSAPASLVLHLPEGQPVQIRADTELDAYRALGYAQAQEMAWTLLLWRQTAQGRLGQWLGAAALPLDRHAALLGFSRDNAALLASLPEPAREALEAFAEGVSAGIGGAHRRDPFVALLGIRGEPFRAEDVLAVERLFAWCTTALVWPDSTTLPASARQFAEQDSLFRRSLGLYGWPESAGWTYRDSSRTLLTARWVTGNSALPVLHESVRYGAADSALVLAIPGTPFPLLHAGARAVAVLPHGEALLRPATTGGWTGTEAALFGKRGEIYVEPFWRGPEAVLLASDTTASGAWEITWPGLRPRTDAAAWLALSRGEQTEGAFTLQNVTLLTLQGASGARTLPYARGIVAAPPAALPWLQRRLDSLAARRPETASQWFRDAHSAWAAEVNADLVARLDSSLVHAAQHHVAFDYLSNWRGDFDGANIGATVFETYAGMRGLHPRGGQALLPDTVPYFAALNNTRLLARAADTLQQRYGPRPINWRWERVHPERRLFPLWAVADTLGFELPRPAAFAAFTLPGSGHPTALQWLDLSPRQAGAAFVAVIEAGPHTSWKLYRLRYDPSRPFARYRVAGRRLQVQPVSYPSDSGHSISLLPVR